MPSPDEWKLMIESAITASPPPLSALTDRGIIFESNSAPAVFGCSDQRDYVVKTVRDPNQHFRVLTNDRIVGTLATKMGAPVPPIALVDVPQVLADSVNAANRNPHRLPMPSGLGHASLYLTDISKQREVYRDINRPHNRARFALLAMLYGEAYVQHDRQFFYRDQDAAVLSVDHGHFFRNGPNWTVNDLKATPSGVPDPEIQSNASLTSDELKAALSDLAKLTAAVIADAVAAPPDGWRFPIAERVEMAAYLDNRRSQITTAIV
jgi:hypothetical protein